MSEEAFDWEQNMTREEAIQIIAKDDYARGHLEATSSDPDQGWEQMKLFDVVDGKTTLNDK
jgi:hypothetical protein